MSEYYQYRDNFEREQGFPNQRFFNSLPEAYEYLLLDGDGACFFQCDGVVMPEPYMPPPLKWLELVMDEFGYVEVQIGYPDRPGKDIWIREKNTDQETME